ncbi:MAG: hypothetical protein KDC82_00040 [Bacteroidetes bacterium]|nr:hypothetical protein [Bacteroidota bacterium]
MFTDIEFAALENFDKIFENQYENSIPNKHWPDLELYVNTKSWKELKNAAIIALKSFDTNELNNHYGYR